jgi:predicted anti-sigma-YlaC factor YlaD
MKCERARKLISDDTDGRLTGKRAEGLERHIQSCDACRAYRDDVAIIQARSKAQPAPSLSPEDWARIERDLERELGRAPRARYRTALFPGFRLRLAWVGAAVLLVGAMVLFDKERFGRPDAAFLSYEGSWSDLRGNRDDPELADSFNRLVLADIGDTVRAGH